MANMVAGKIPVLHNTCSLLLKDAKNLRMSSCLLPLRKASGDESNAGQCSTVVSLVPVS